MNKRTLYRLACIVMLVLAGLNKANANHYAAVDMYVTYIGGGLNGCTGTTEYKYEFTLEVYRACENGPDLPTEYSVNTFNPIRFESLNAGVSGTIDVFSTGEDTLDQLCPAFSKINSCRVPTNNQYPGFNHRVYTGTFTLPSPQKDWRFWWSDGARNISIINITTLSGVHSPGGNIYVECGLNNLTKYNNSTPRFTVSPLPYICINQPTSYLNGPLDPNNDSLNIVYQTPLNSGPNDPYLYYSDPSVTYSEANPVASDASMPFTVNPLTGTATFKPTNQGKHALAFRCDEYERGTGEHLGYIMRDVQITVLPCTSPPPLVDSIPTKGNFNNTTVVHTAKQGNALFVCPGTTMSFTVSSNSPSPGSNIYMECNNALVLPGSTFTVANDGTPNPAGTFTWTPTNADVGEHTVIVSSKDSTCTGTGFSLVLKSFTVILIKVVYGLDAGIDLPICSIDPKPRQLSVKGATDLRVEWTDGVTGGPAEGLNRTDIANPIATVSKTTYYKVKTIDLASNTTCKTEDDLVVYVDTSNTLNAFPDNPVVMCRPDYLQLDAIVTGKGPLTNLPCGVAMVPDNSVNNTAKLYGSVIYGQFPYDTLGAATPILPNNTRTAKQQFLIRRDELLDAGVHSAVLTGLSFEVTKGTPPGYTYLYKNFRIALKCTNATELSKSEGFESGLVAVYDAPATIDFDNTVHKFDFKNTYAWDTNRNLLVELCYSYNDSVVNGCGISAAPPPLIKFAPTTYKSALFLSDSNRTVNDLCGALKDTKIEEKLGRPVFELTYADAPSIPFTIKWTPSTFLSDSTILQPLAYVPKSAKYYVETFGKSGCRLLDSVDILVPVHDFSVSPKDTAICLGDKAYLIAKNGFVYRWHEYVNGEYKDASKSLSCTDCADPFANPKVTTTYKIEVGDSVFCYDTIEAVVEVLPIPDVRILNHHDTTIKYGQSIQLLASGARKYNWAPPASLNNPNISYPVGTPTEPTTYVVTGIGTDGCRATDTIRVNVDFRDKLMVPSAFSPNGDGKNDIFRVTNLTFQRVMEFRVFNRWGQEVFSGNNNTGWDGTWKGEPQEIGSYTYVIKLGYPDGLVETYKGDASIIR